MINYVDQDRKCVYRFEARGLRMRDVIESNSMRMKIDARAKSGDIDQNTLVTLYNYPLIKCATGRLEIAKLEKLPEDGLLPKDMSFVSLDFTEDAFWEMPEEFVVLCVAEVMEKNPQRNMEYEFLKKTLEVFQNKSGLMNLNKSIPGNETGSEAG